MLLQESKRWNWRLPIAIPLISCLTTIGTPSAAEPARELGTVKVKGLKETSGIAASRQNPFVFWLHNDGDDGRLFAVRASGKSAGVIDIPVKVEDLEDVAIGPGPEAGVDYLYLGDIGDNHSRRREIRVLRFPEPVVSGRSKIKVDDVVQFRLEYSDAPHDAEALLVDPTTRDLYVVTKEPGRARVFMAPADEMDHQDGGEPITLRLVHTLPQGDVSAAAISPDGSRIILRQEATGWCWRRAAGRSLADALSEEPVHVVVRGDEQASNGEAICFSADGQTYFTISEGKKQPIYQFSLPPARDQSRGPNDQQ